MPWAAVSQPGSIATSSRRRSGGSGGVLEGPYRHLGDEFVRLLTVLRKDGEVPDLRHPDQVSEGTENAELKDRVTDRDVTIEEPTEFKKLALSRFATQHDEIMLLRSPQSSPSRLHPPSREVGQGARSR